jgi:hypothetical protein|tara:strand:- start:2112 stop:2462 length:351 start_codon:yes stop_codon:yes gene_type:complete
MFLTKEQILEAKDLKTEKVHIKEWGGDVFVRTLTGAERDKFEKSIFDVDNNKRTFENLRAKLVIAVTVDKDGNQLFTEADIPALGNKSAHALDVIFDVGQRLSGITQKDVDSMSKN